MNLLMWAHVAAGCLALPSGRLFIGRQARPIDPPSPAELRLASVFNQLGRRHIRRRECSARAQGA